MHTIDSTQSARAVGTGRSRSRRCRRAVLAGSLLAALAVPVAAPPASADGRAVGGPQLTALAVPDVGSVIGPSDLLNDTVVDDYTDVAYEVSWRSESAVDSYDVWAEYAGAPPSLLGSYGSGTRDPSATTDRLRDYFGDFGGGSFDQVGWRVDATDGEGNVTSQHVGRRPRVIQENGDSPNSASHATVTRGKAWRSGACACASGGERLFTKRRGAGVRLVLDEDWNEERGNQVGLVMTQGPFRGKVAIFVNGRQRTVWDTYAPERRDRVLVWTGRVRAGVPVVVRNQATPGRKRTDVDAFVLF